MYEHLIGHPATPSEQCATDGVVCAGVAPSAASCCLLASCRDNCPRPLNCVPPAFRHYSTREQQWTPPSLLRLPPQPPLLPLPSADMQRAQQRGTWPNRRPSEVRLRGGRDTGMAYTTQTFNSDVL